MTYSPTDRLHRRFDSPESLGTMHFRFIANSAFTPVLCFRGGSGNPKAVDAIAYKPTFHSHKPGRTFLYNRLHLYYTKTALYPTVKFKIMTGDLRRTS
jgi:hypothetical protein